MKPTVSALTRVLVSGEQDYFLSELASLRKAGMSTPKAIAAIRSGVKNPNFEKILLQIEKEVEEGSTLSNALEETGLFPNHVISLIHLGEASGRLTENLEVVAESSQRERNYRSRIASAAVYPLFIFGLTVMIGLGLAWFILPKLAMVFSQLRVELPLLTKLLIGFGIFLGKYGTIFIPGLIIFSVLLFFIIFLYKPTKFLGQNLLFSLPVIKKLISEIELSRFGFILGTLLAAGLSITEALNALSQASSFPAYSKFYKYLLENIREGNTFSYVFKTYRNLDRLIPAPVQQLISSAEESGKLSETFIKFGEIYEEKTEDTSKNLIVLLEPVLLFIVWIGVVLVALAVIVPIYSLIGSVNPENTNQAPVDTVEESITTPSITPTPVIQKLQINNATGVDFLNVRDLPAISGAIITRILPGEIYEFGRKSGNWYEIKLPDNGTGWVSGQFIEVLP